MSPEGVAAIVHTHCKIGQPGYDLYPHQPEAHLLKAMVYVNAVRLAGLEPSDEELVEAIMSTADPEFIGRAPHPNDVIAFLMGV